MTSLPARTRIFVDGEILLEAGADHESGYVILSGQVRLHNSAGTLVETMAEGHVVGAASVLFGGAQELHAIASGTVEAVAIDRGTVSAQLTHHPDLVRETASALLARLDLVPREERDASSAGHTGPVAITGTWSEVRILPATPETSDDMPRQGILIDRLPFNVGRRPIRGEPRPRSEIALTLTDAKPYNMSRDHFVIEHSQGGLMIRDVGSQLGTVVNGKRIGVEQIENALPLHIGENEVAAGGVDTPFRFVVEILP